VIGQSSPRASINDDDDMSLNQVRRGHIGALGITNYRKGVPERTGNNSSTVSRHRQSIDIDLLNLERILLRSAIGDILDIHDCNIANRRRPTLIISHLSWDRGSAPDQGYIKNQRSTKPSRDPRVFSQYRARADHAPGIPGCR